MSRVFPRKSTAGSRQITGWRGNIRGFSRREQDCWYQQLRRVRAHTSSHTHTHTLAHSLSFSLALFFPPCLTTETPKQSILTRAIPSVEWRVPFVFCLRDAAFSSYPSFFLSPLLQFYIFPLYWFMVIIITLMALMLGAFFRAELLPQTPVLRFQQNRGGFLFFSFFFFGSQDEFLHNEIKKNPPFLTSVVKRQL